MPKKVLLDLEQETIDMADEAVQLAKPTFSSRRQLIEMAIREKSQAIKEQYGNLRGDEERVEEN